MIKKKTWTLTIHEHLCSINQDTKWKRTWLHYQVTNISRYRLTLANRATTLPGRTDIRGWTRSAATLLLDLKFQVSNAVEGGGGNIEMRQNVG